MVGAASVHRALLTTGKKGAGGRIWAFEAEHMGCSSLGLGGSLSFSLKKKSEYTLRERVIVMRMTLKLRGVGKP